MPTLIVDAISARAVAQQRSAASLAEVIHQVDAIYVTRVQKERFEDLSSYAALYGSYVVDNDVMKYAKPTCSVLHPLPRLNEIPPSFDNDPRAAYFRFVPALCQDS